MKKKTITEEIITLVVGVLAILGAIIFWKTLDEWVLLGFIPLNIGFIVIGAICIISSGIMIGLDYFGKKKKPDAPATTEITNKTEEDKK